MILRNIAIRHGRTAVAKQLRKSGLRLLSSETDHHERSIKPLTRVTSSVEANINRSSPSQSSITPTSSIEEESTDSTAKDTFIADSHALFNHINSTTGSLGSTLTPHYQPNKLVTLPPRPQDITLELLMACQAHMGHSTSLWNPANQRYIMGVRQGIHIISLEVTAAHLRRACKVVEGVAYHGGLILFVGTRAGQDRCVVKAAELALGCHLFERWVPGTITNGTQILGSGGIRAIDDFDQEIQSAVFEEKMSEYRALKPDLVVVLNPLENYVCLHECGLNNIPTIGIIDTDADPTWVTYPIPANDDSIRCVQLIAAVLGRAAEAGQKKRLDAAKKGVVTWQTPLEYKEWAQNDEEWVKRMKAERDAKFKVIEEAKEAAIREEEERRAAWD